MAAARAELQTRVEACAARNGHYGRHVFVTVVYAPTGAAARARVDANFLRPPMLRCVLAAANAVRLPPFQLRRWPASYHLAVP